ncbi:hypothetical protein VTJ04DRAFT_9263 [Mycothermus thermophilus]|uniref:uncharacterized protein n=1 Tax=Humicola insolens TaxID=85995 RepID=UPI003743B96C
MGRLQAVLHTVLRDWDALIQGSGSAAAAGLSAGPLLDPWCVVGPMPKTAGSLTRKVTCVGRSTPLPPFLAVLAVLPAVDDGSIFLV